MSEHPEAKVNGWTFDPVHGEWHAKVGPDRWKVVKGDLSNPPTWRPAT